MYLISYDGNVATFRVPVSSTVVKTLESYLLV
jgi:hypothetical protein